MTGFVSFSTDRHDTACKDPPSTWDSGSTTEVTLDTTALTDNDILLFRLDTDECARVFCNLPFENGGTLNLGHYKMYCGAQAADGNAVNKCVEWGVASKEVAVLSMRADDQIPVKEYIKGSCT